MPDKMLPDFQNFLISRGFITEKHVRFYALWVSKFLAFSNKNQSLELKARIEKFWEHLASTPNIADWQRRQARTALKLYFDHFNADVVPKLSLHLAPPLENSCCDYSHASQAMREAIRLRHYAYKTERSYLSWVRRFYDYLSNVKKKNVKTQGLLSGDVRDYLSFLALRQRVSSSTQNQAFNALLFLFRDVLKIEIGDLDKTVRAKRGPKLPVVLSVEEVQELFKHITGKRLLILQLLYGSGLRLMELARLRVQDIDFNSNLIFVRSAKGDKDRTTILPEYIKEKLQAHLKEVKKLHEKDFEAGYGEVSLPDALGRKYPNAGKKWGWQHVFPSAKLSVDPRSGKVRRHHISEKTIQGAVTGAVKKAGIIKHATVHTFRHSFATHLLINGVNIRQIQELLGHKNVETTMIYTHVVRDMQNAPQSPLDKLYA